MINGYQIRYKGKKKYTQIIAKTIARTLFCSRKKLMSSLESFINSAIRDKNQLYCLTPSGRTALHQIFFLPEVRTIVLPEYICNVVPMAACEKDVLFYSVNSKYQFNSQEIKNIISNNPDCCILLPSYMNNEINFQEIIHKIRQISDKCIIVLDECQNLKSIFELPALDNNTFAVYSFNNKMTYGFLGGAIIRGQNSEMIHEFGPAPLVDEIHAIITILQSSVADLLFSITSKHVIPTDPEVSQGKGIYSVQYAYLLKVSLAAASLIGENWDWYLNCLKENKIIAEKLERDGTIVIMANKRKSLMPYIPIQTQKECYGHLPLKGRYGGLPRKTDERDICLKLHNSMKMEMIER